MTQELQHSILYRKLLPPERDTAGDHLVRLSPRSRRMRFAHAVSDGFIASYADRMIGPYDTVHGAFAGVSLRGCGELRLTPDRSPRVGEIALSVEDPWQGAGIGTELFRRLLRSARNRRIECCYVLCLEENLAMRRIAAKFGGELSWLPEEVVGKFRPAPADSLSLTDEWFDDMSGLSAFVLDQSAKNLSQWMAA